MVSFDKRIGTSGVGADIKLNAAKTHVFIGGRKSTTFGYHLLFYIFDLNGNVVSQLRKFEVDNDWMQAIEPFETTEPHVLVVRELTSTYLNINDF